MSQQSDASFPVGTAEPHTYAPLAQLETRRARRARIEALEASLRREVARFDTEQSAESNPGAVAGMTRIEHFGVVFSDELGVVSRESEPA